MFFPFGILWLNIVIILSARALNISSPFQSTNIKLIVLSNGSPIFDSKPLPIKICQKDIPNGCSSYISKFYDLFKANITNQ